MSRERLEQVFEVSGKLPSLNDYTAANRRNPYAGARMKRDVEGRVRAAIKAAGLEPMRAPVRVHVTWIEPDMRRDKDNIRSAIKFILDALVAEGVIGNDNWKWIGGRERAGLSDSYLVNSSHPRVVVGLEEI